jgi:hypothetical protein
MKEGETYKLKCDIFDPATGDHPTILYGRTDEIVTIISVGCVDSCYPVKVFNTKYPTIIFYVEYSELEQII